MPLKPRLMEKWLKQGIELLLTTNERVAILPTGAVFVIMPTLVRYFVNASIPVFRY